MRFRSPVTSVVPKTTNAAYVNDLYGITSRVVD
jgi:hypothetical protein